MVLNCISPNLIDAANEAFRVLRQREWRVVTAESCTAGLIAACLSQTENASDLLEGSFVTYTKAQKTEALGVPAALLAASGAVNEEVAKYMATGALARSKADIALSVTGVLGPSPDEDGNPVGLVCFGCARREGAPSIRNADYGKHHHDALRNLVVCDALGFLMECAQ
ncbi:MAG TPA: nicotinamide-nucleotide amidohydrolase family protein [Rhizomicrobium sp.]